MQADATRIPLKDKSVQLVCFSPPYWGLRKYSINPLVWGGREGCSHEWGDERVGHSYSSHSGLTAASERSDGRKRNPENTVRQNDTIAFKATQGQFCRFCNAWRGDLGLEPPPELYLSHMMLVMAECWRVLRDDGVCFVNIGDSYSSSVTDKRGTYTTAQNKWQHGAKTTEFKRVKVPPKILNIKPKSLCLIPQKFAIACQEQGWIIRSEIIWAKSNPMPESVKDRPTRSHEQVWMMVKQGKYYWDQDAVRIQAKWERWGKQTIGKEYRGIKPIDMDTLDERRNQGANIKDVWTIATEPTPEAHFATFPSKLVEPMIKAATSHKACPYCSAPWERVVEKDTPENYKGKTGRWGTDTGRMQMGDKFNTQSITTGWQPTCKCKDNDGSGRCIVFDPFCGTAKTVIEAERLSRIGIGMDLSWEYLTEIAAERLSRPLQRVLM